MALGVSVVVPSHQGEQRLPTLLAALADQETHRKWELIVVLDGSSDASAEVVKGWTHRLPITLIDRRDNRGRSATLNEGFARTKFEVLIRCDDDLVPAPGWMESFGRTVEQDPTMGVIGLYRNEYPATPYARVYGRYADARFRSEAYEFPKDRRWTYWAGNCAIHRDYWDLVGEYDAETFASYGYEDIDWGYRLIQSGAGISLVPELETAHNVAAVTTEIRLKRAFQSGLAKARFEHKHRLDEPSRKGHDPWTLAVRAGSQLRGQQAYEQVGRRIDGLLNRVPDSGGRRIIDLAIEAAHESGHRAGVAVAW